MMDTFTPLLPSITLLGEAQVSNPKHVAFLANGNLLLAEYEGKLLQYDSSNMKLISVELLQKICVPSVLALLIRLIWFF
jgi:hypothetical protein